MGGTRGAAAEHAYKGGTMVDVTGRKIMREAKASVRINGETAQKEGKACDKNNTLARGKKWSGVRLEWRRKPFLVRRRGRFNRTGGGQGES